MDINHGRYLLAASKQGANSLALYSLLAIQHGELEPVPTAPLPGQALSREVEVQDGEVATYVLRSRTCSSPCRGLLFSH